MTVAAKLDEAPAMDSRSTSTLDEPLGSIEEQGRLPVTGLVGVAAGASFAVWASLTCFVC